MAGDFGWNEFNGKVPMHFFSSVSTTEAVGHSFAERSGHIARRINRIAAPTCTRLSPTVNRIGRLKKSPIIAIGNFPIFCLHREYAMFTMHLASQLHELTSV